jgi:hypothetical protein
MNPAVLLYAIQILQAIPQLLAAGQSVMGSVNQGTTALQNMLAEKRDPTPEEWAALDAQIDSLRAQLHAPTQVGPGTGA